MSRCSPALALDGWSVYKCPMDYKSNRNVVYSCKYHVVRCPKYRRRVLVVSEAKEPAPDPLDQFLLRQHGWGSAAGYGQAVH